MRGLGGIAIVLIAAAVPALAEDPADLAFDAGEYPQALELYDARLQSDPDDVEALVRSGLLLSWDSRYDEAISRYDRALAIDPANDVASRERAKVLSWDSRYGEAVAAFRAYLTRHPDDTDSRLALARCLSWKSDFPESRKEFATVLEEDPDNLEALVGTARTYAWSGDLVRAREWYERALAVDPDDKDARLGLAYLYLWTGATARAEEQAWRLQRRWTADGDVAELSARAREAAGPTALVGIQRITDTDDNVLDILRASGAVAMLPTVSLGLSYTHWNLSNGDTSARVDSLAASVGLRPGLGQSLDVSVGVNHSDNNINDESFTDPLGEVDYTWGLDRLWQVGGSVGRQALVYSPQIASNDIRFDFVSASVRGRVADRWHPFANTDLADFTDDNQRTGLYAGFTYDWPLRAPTLAVGYTFHYMDYTEDTNSGYFDPQNFTSSLLNARASGQFGKRRNTWHAMTEAGLQSFELGGEQVDNDTVLVLTGGLGFPLGRAFVLEAEASWGNYAALTTAGYESRTVLLRLRWRGGR